MEKIYNSLQTKLSAGFVLLILIIIGGAFFITFAQTRKALLEITREDLHDIVALASTQITAEEVMTITQLKPGQDNDPVYLELQQKFRRMRAQSKSIINFYIMRVNGKRVIFLLDDFPADQNPAKIGQVYIRPETKIFEAVDDIQVSDDLYTDEWGTFLSAYAPVKGPDGEIAFVLGADMLATTVAERQDFTGITIYFVVATVILIAITAIWTSRD
jgi:hypothetical protein